jgi:hypothetical protein
MSNGNIYWGRNEDLIFPAADLYGLEDDDDEERVILVM